MDFILVHQIYTIILFIIFLGIVGWIWRGPYQSSFQEASWLPFTDDPTEKENRHD